MVASRDETLKPELLFSKHYWRTDNHHSACLMILRNLGWGVLPQEMFKENPELNNKLKALDVFDLRLDLNITLIWSEPRK